LKCGCGQNSKGFTIIERDITRAVWLLLIVCSGWSRNY